jgi:hypothetical protein
MVSSANSARITMPELLISLKWLPLPATGASFLIQHRYLNVNCSHMDVNNRAVAKGFLLLGSLSISVG